MQFFDSGFKEIFSSQIISVFGGLIAGIILASYTNQLILIPGILILLPGFMELRGNISASSSSRISSGLFLGVIDPASLNSKIVKGNLIASFVLSIIVAFVLGIVALIATFFIFGVFFPKIVLIALIAAIIANIIEVPFTLISTFYFFRKGYDPNNIMGPMITSTIDITSVLALLIPLVIL